MLLLVGLSLQAQPKKTQFEQERKSLLEHIKSIKKILSQTEGKQKVSTGQLTAINKQIETNHLLSQSLNQELETINKQLAQQFHQIAHLEKELAQLKKEYASMAYLGAKTMHDIHILAFVFSAASFQELLQRLSAIKQYARLRQKHFQEIQHVRLALQTQQKTLEQQGLGKNALLQKWRKEQTKLTSLKQQQTKIVATLEQQRTKLLKELHQRNDAVKRLDYLITDLVKREAATTQQQKQETATVPKIPHKKLLTPAMAALTAAFTQYRGKLPWPVKTGFISNKFGIQPHAVLQNIQVENLGIDIQTQEASMVYAIFGGIVKTIAFVPGMNQVVIIQHGNYHTVYAKLKSTSVKVGQYVEKQEPIGVVYTNKNGLTELQLQIWKGTQKLNPAGWLTKRSTG
jgi:septal ring factor EnvC (AmiA/AmiB activator)